MKHTKQRILNDKRSDTLDQIKRKNEISLNLINKSKIEKIKRLEKMNSTLQTDDTIRKKMKMHFEKLEEDRLEIEKLIETRSNIKILNY